MYLLELLSAGAMAILGQSGLLIGPIDTLIVATTAGTIEHVVDPTGRTSTEATIVVSCAEGVRDVVMDVDGRTVYWVTQTELKSAPSTLAPGDDCEGATSTLYDEGQDIKSLSHSSANNMLYFADAGRGSLMRYVPSSGRTTALVDDEGVFGVGVDVERDLLFWTANYADGSAKLRYSSIDGDDVRDAFSYGPLDDRRLYGLTMEKHELFFVVWRGSREVAIQAILNITQADDVELATTSSAAEAVRYMAMDDGIDRVFFNQELDNYVMTSLIRYDDPTRIHQDQTSVTFTDRTPLGMQYVHDAFFAQDAELDGNSGAGDDSGNDDSGGDSGDSGAAGHAALASAALLAGCAVLFL